MKHTYTYQVLEGDARSVGRAQAHHLRETYPEAVQIYGSPFGNKTERLKEGDRLLAMNERWCPGLNEEIEGFATELGVRPEAVIYNTATVPRTGNCSQIVVLPDHAKTGTTLCARSYEWSKEDEMTLRTVRIPGRAAHTGFAVFCFGRLDGLNDRGLWVSISAANPLAPLPDTEGFRFWALTRTILDRCSSVEEAIELATPFPLAFHLNLIVADKNGNAALIEKGPDRQSVQRATSGFIHSTNHYTLNGTRDYATELFVHSLTRHEYIAREAKREGQTMDSLRKLLSSPFPEGLACHYYGDWFGTLWSLQADLSDGTLHACFGPADIPENRFRTFRPNDPVGTTRFEAELPDETASVETWARVPNRQNV